MDEDTGFLTFYLILQGEVALAADPKAAPDKQLRILVPKVEGHEYIAGPWLNETPLTPEEKLHLRHVSGGSVTPSDCRGLFMTFGAKGTNPAPPYIEILAPLPLGIIPGKREDASFDHVYVREGGKTREMPEPKTPTIIPVLVYKWKKDSSPPEITGPKGEKWEAELYDGCLSLHIYASSKTAETADHARAAFHAAAALVGVDATICFPEGPAEIEAEPPAGLRWAQVNLLLFQRHHLESDAGLNAALSRSERIPAERIPASENGNCGPGAADGG